MDQAEGLRKLLKRPQLRVVTVVGAQCGVGATSVVGNLAATFADSGKQVMVLDENAGYDNVAAMLGLKQRYDLMHTVSDRMHWRDVLLTACENIHVLPVARAMQALPEMDGMECSQLLQNLNAASSSMDVVLVDATTEHYSVCASLSGNEPLLVVLNATGDSITQTYALLKQMVAQYGRKSFDLLINKVRSREEAQKVYNNMAQVAERHLRVTLKFLGYIPLDEHLAKAGGMRSPLPAWQPYPETVTAFSMLAARLLPPEQHAGGSTLGQLMQRLVQHRPPLLQRRAVQYVDQVTR